MKQFQIDYKRLVMLLLPPFLRLPRVYAFLSAMVFGITQVYDVFTGNRRQNLLRLQRNGQVCYLRGMLNELLDPVSKRIIIRDNEYETDKWMLVKDEEIANQVVIDAEYLNKAGRKEVNARCLVCSERLLLSNVDYFFVRVPFPKSDVDKANELKSYLNELKLLSKKYIVKYGQAEF